MDLNKRDEKQNDKESVIGKLLGVRLPGIAFTSYWDIIVTDKAVYFLKRRKVISWTASAFSAFRDLSYKSQVRAEKDKKLSYFLSQAKEKIKVGRNQLNYIDFKEGFFGDKVAVNTTDEVYSFKLSSKKFNLLQSSMEKLKSLRSTSREGAQGTPELKVISKTQDLQEKENFNAYLNRWSWGAFSLSFIWTLVNKLYLKTILYLLPILIPWGLQSLITYLWPPNAYPTILIVGLSVLSTIGFLLVVTYLGRNGRKIAWNSRQWKSKEEFRNRQNIFDKVGAAFFIVVIVCLILLA
ncbi:MAG: DUF2628 domain-containing protein [Candidatus Paceibacterota bacterium]